MNPKKLPLAAIASLLLFANTGHAEVLGDLGSPPPGQDGYLTLYLDNDVFAGEDKDYSNGVRLSWISEDRTAEQLGLVQRFLRPFSGDSESYGVFQKISGFQDPSKVHYNFGFSLTQLMFTPEDKESYTQPPGQRRYAGWLGLGFSLHVKDDNVLNSVEFTIGTTGPSSLAEDTQDFIHDLMDVEKANGWNDQVPNEITGDISFVQKRRADFINIHRGWFRVDGLTEWGARLGTFRTEAHLGGFFRAGYNLPPDFSDPRISSTAYSHRYFGGGSDYKGNWSIYSLFGATMRGVAFDATLDGPMFRDFDTGIDREPFVAEVFCGFGVRYRRVEFSYVHTWRTEEYKDQAEPTNFGSVAMRVRF